MQFHRFARRCLLAATACAALSAQATTIWRCGDRYSDVPCEGGRSLEAAPPATAAEARRAQEATRSNQQTADMLQRQRLREETQGLTASRGQGPQSVPPMAIPGTNAVAQGDPADRRRRQPESRTGHKPDMFMATVPGTGKQKKTAAPRQGRAKKG